MIQERESDESSSLLSPIARANQLASECFSIALGMVVPGLLAYWLDGYFGTKPWLTLLGFTFGFAYGIWRLALLGMRRQKNFVPSQPYNTEGLETEEPDRDEPEEEQ